MTTTTYERGTGRRKCAIAQVKLLKGSGEIVVNGKPYQDLFTIVNYRRTIEKPLVVTDTMGKYNIQIKVTGGYLSGYCPRPGKIKRNLQGFIEKRGITDQRLPR